MSIAKDIFGHIDYVDKDMGQSVTRSLSGNGIRDENSHALVGQGAGSPKRRRRSCSLR